MKKSIVLLIPIFLISCIKNPSSLEYLKYSKEDLTPLTDSTKTLYYNDAAHIEFIRVSKDSLIRYEQVKLDGKNIQIYYNDILNVYNNCYALSNSFFENISRIHTYSTSILYHIITSVDTSKIWAQQWINGNKYTGIVGLDSLIENYNLNILYVNNTKDRYDFFIETENPINPFALIKKLQNTGEFRYIEPYAITGTGSIISLDIIENYKIYKYSLRWGDCPSGCLYNHYWKIKVENNRITLFEESGDSLK